MEINSIIETIAAVVAALGGWEFIKYLMNRKTNKRKEEAEADSVEFNVLKDTVMFLQEQLHEKEKRFCEQTDRLRKIQDESFSLLQEKNKIELELQMFRCIKKKCLNREPQNGY